MGFIAQSFIEDLLSRVDIVDVINSRIPLRKAGRNYMACCPFHQEKTPSFSVVPHKQFFNCFGCGIAGSAIKFVMVFDSVDFVTAAEKLAASVGMEVQFEHNNLTNQQNKNNYKSYYEALAKITEYYQDNLNSNQKALNYLHKRAIDPAISTFFALGYALDGWDNLRKINFVHKTDVKNLTNLLEQLGLWIRKTTDSDVNNLNNSDNQAYGNYDGYDRFRNRLMFPIRDLKGHVIAFGGRVLDDSKPKYLNSPETVLFHKSAELYGLFESLQLSAQNKTKITKFVIVEGYIDVIALFQHGINYAVATLGTASSYRHLAKLFKYCDEVIYCFDGDDAGRTAAWRALENSLPALYDGRRIKFLFLPKEHDPDSYIQQYGKHEFEMQLGQAKSLTEYLFSHQEQLLGDGINTVEGRVQFVNLCKPLLSKVPEGVYKTILETELAKRCNLSQTSLEKILMQSESATAKSIGYQNQSQLLNNADLTNIQSRVQFRAGFRTRSSLWQQACFLLVHNPKFVELVPQDLINDYITNQEAAMFINIYKLLLQVKTIPELIDSLTNKSDNNPDYLALKNSVIELISDDPMITNDLAQIEFSDLIKSLSKARSYNELDDLKLKVATGGMASLTDVEKQRLQTLLLDNAR